MTEKEFFKKYPDADLNRFVFKDGKVFFKINPDNEYRLVDIKYRSFYDSPGWVKYLTSYKDNGFGIWSADGTVQTYDINHETTTNMDINKIYRILHGCEKIWILCSSGKNNISRVSAANE